MFTFFNSLSNHVEVKPTISTPSESSPLQVSPGLIQDNGAVGILLATSVLIGALAKLVEVVMRNRNKDK